MKNSIRILILVVCATLLVSIFAFFSIKVNNQKYVAFKDAGYIISTNYETNNTEGNNQDITSTKYYFNNDTKYHKTYNNEYTFTNTSNEEVNVEESNFIHYNDGSIGAFKTSSLLDLTHLNDEIIKYYNLPVKNVLTKSGSGYLAKNVSGNIEFNNFLLKIDDNKFMLVAPTISVHVKNDTRTISDSYLEIQYFDGNIVRLENNGVKLQSVAEDFYLEINDVIINLSNKNIYLNKDKKLSLNDITINSNDNIDLSDIDDDSKFMTEDEKKQQEEEEKQKQQEELEKAKKELQEAQDKIQENIKSNFSNENPISGITDGIVRPSSPDNSEEIIDNTNSYDPVFTITNFKVTANGVLADIKYEDKSNVLVGSPTISLIDAGNNRLVDTMHLNTGVTTISYSNESLTQNTNYVLVVNANYMKNADTVNKDFIQKSFVTSSIGISVKKDYFGTKSLNFIVKKDKTSDVKSLNAKLYKGQELIATYPVNISTTDTANVNFTGLDSNTTYRLELSDFIYNNLVITDNFNITEEYKTLKVSPSIGGTSFTIDKVNSKFILETNNISDRDNGIISLRYEVYDMRSLSGDSTPEPVKVVETPNLGSVDINVDDVTIMRGVPYVFKVIATFNDNEKTVEYERGYTEEAMQLDGKIHPSVNFEASEVTFERINGVIKIVDLYGTVDYSKPFKVIYTDSHGITKNLTYNQAGLNIPLDINGLRANHETYTFNVYGTVDLSDGYGAAQQLIGSFTVNTANIKSFTLRTKVDNTSLVKAFSITAQLTPTNGEDNSLEANTLSNLTFALYAGTSTAGQKLSEVSYVDYDLDPYQSNLRETYYDNTFEINPELFNLTSKAVQAYDTVTIEVKNANDYTEWPNTSEIVNNIITVKVKDPIEDPEDNPKITLDYLRNKDADGTHYDSNLDADTVVGLIAHSTYPNSSKYAKYVNYYLYDANDNKTPVAQALNIPVNDDGTIPSHTFYLDKGTSIDTKDTTPRRGHTYYATYIIYVDVDGDGIVDEGIQIPTSGIAASANLDVPKQTPIFYTYPSTVNDNKLIWAYKYTDIDNALVNKKIYYRLNNIDMSNHDISENTNFQTISLDKTDGGVVNLYATIRPLKEMNDSVYNVVNQTIESLTAVPTIKYVLTPETNRLLVTISDYDPSSTFFKKVVKMMLTFTADNQVRNIDNVTFDEQGNYLVDLTELEDFMNKNIEVNLYAYYDSNVIGFDTSTKAEGIYTSNFALKQAIEGASTGEYYVVKANSLSNSPNALNSIFTFSLNKNANSNGTYNFKLTSASNSTLNNNYYLNLDNGGFKFSENNENLHFYPSKIAYTKLSSDNNTFSFTQLVPGVSLMKDGKYAIDTGIDSADVTISLSAKSNAIVDNKIYIEVYNTDENMIESNSTLKYTKEFTIDDLKNPITLDELELNSYYYFKIKAVINGMGSDKRTLYDLDSKSDTILYPISTLSNLTLENQSISYSAKSYTDKSLIYRYTLGVTKNIDHISYKMYTASTDASGNDVYTPLDTDLEIADSVRIEKDMSVTINIPPSSNFQTGRRYVVGLTAYLKKSNGTVTELNTTYSIVYRFAQLTAPYFYIKATRDTQGQSLTFRVSPSDIQYSMINSQYMVNFYDKEGNRIATEYSGVYTGTKDFKLTNIDLSKSTTMVISYKANIANTSDTDSIEVSTRSYTVNGLNSDGIDVGEVYASTNLNDKSKVNLTFSNATKIQEVTAIRYSIIKDGVTVSFTQTPETFTPQVGSCGTTSCFLYTLKSIISDTGIYYIQIQFLNKDGKTVDERIVSYVYTI